MTPSNLTDDQAVAMIDQQIQNLENRLDGMRGIVRISSAARQILHTTPQPTLANLSEVVGALKEGIQALLETNVIANNMVITDILQNLEQLKTARAQRSSKVHLGGFVPRRI